MGSDPMRVTAGGQIAGLVLGSALAILGMLLVTDFGGLATKWHAMHARTRLSVPRWIRESRGSSYSLDVAGLRMFGFVPLALGIAMILIVVAR